MPASQCGDKVPVDIREFPAAAHVARAVMSGNVDAQPEDSGILKQAADLICGRFRISSRENLYPVMIGLGSAWAMTL